MQFNSVVKAIHDAWTFAWPPLIMCLIAFIIANFLNHARTLSSLTKLKCAAINIGRKSNELRAILEPLGLTKLLPIISSILVICFLYILGGPITVAVSHLPPFLTYSPDRLVIRVTPENEKLLLSRKYPTAKSFNEAYYLALEEMKSDIEVFSYRKNRAEVYYKYHNFMKFGLAFAAIMLVINLIKRDKFFKQLFRFIIIILVLSAIWTVSLAGLLYEQEQQFYNEWRTVQLSLSRQINVSNILNSPLTDEEKERMKDYSPGRWWNLYFFDTSRFKWIQRTFLTDFY